MKKRIDFILIEFLSIFVAAVVLTCVSASYAEVQVWGIDRYSNIIRKQSRGPENPAVTKIQISLAQGEFRDSVFMVGPAIRDMNLALRIVGLENLPANFVQVLETVYIRNRVDKETETGDAIRPLRGALRLPQGESRQIYLRADTRNHAVKPGVYPFTVEIRDTEAGSPTAINGRIEVWSFTLPPHDILANNCWVQFEDSSFKEGAMNAEAVRDMKMFGVNMVFILGRETPRPTAIDAKGKVLGFDDSVFLARMKPILKAWAAAPGKERLQFIITFATMYDLGLPKSGMAVLDAKWKVVFEQWLKHLKATMRDLGIADRDWLMAIADETPLVDLFKTEVPIAELIKSIDPSVRTITNTSLVGPFSYGTIIGDNSYVARLFKAFDVFQPNLYMAFLGTHPAFPEWFMANARKYNREVWAYSCVVDLGVVNAKGDNYWEGKKNLYDYYRAYPWYMLKYGLTGTGVWTYCAQVSGQAEYTCHLVYGHDGELLHSRRYEMFREGLDDYRYVWLLRDLARKNGDSAQRMAEQLIRDAVADITANVRDTSRGEKWRLRLAQEILKMSAH